MQDLIKGSSQYYNEKEHFKCHHPLFKPIFKGFTTKDFCQDFLRGGRVWKLDLLLSRLGPGMGQSGF